MPSIINALTSGGGLSITPDTSGVLALQTNSGTTALTISTGQQVQVATAGSASAPVISKSDDTNTGIFFPAADTIAFTEGGVESMRLDSNSNLLFNSGYGSSAVAYGCRAWVNFNGTGTVAIRASGNVSSITDNGVGQYSVNMTIAMPDANYAAFSSNGDNVDAFQNRTEVFSSSVVKIVVYDSGYRDPATCCVSVFR